jgi:hypothetical protein
MFVNWHGRQASHIATHRVLKKHLHLHPYKITSVHQLKERDNVMHVEYCQWFRDVIPTNGEDTLDVTFFINEVWFHLSGYVISQEPHLSSD